MMIDEESVHVLSLEDEFGCVIAVEARELLAERGRSRARQTAGDTTFPCVPRCFNNSGEDAGKLSFYIPPPPPHRPAMPMIMDISALFTRLFSLERVLWMVLPLLTCSHYHVF